MLRKSILRFQLPLYLLFLIPQLIIAQSYPVHNYTEVDGLPSSTVYDVAQDSLGRMWFATKSGICRFDGYKWKNYNSDNGLLNNDFRKIKIDETGRIWALSLNPENLVVTFDGKCWKNFCSKTKKFNEVIPTDFDIKVKPSLSIVIGTLSSGILLYEKGIWKRINTKDGLSSNRISSVNFLKNEIYASSLNGISIIEDDKIVNILPGKKVMDIYCAKQDAANSKNDILVLTNREIGKLKKGRYEKIKSYKKIGNPDFYFKGVIRPLINDKILFGNKHSLAYYDSTSGIVEMLGREQGVISGGAYTAFLDREKILWLPGFRGLTKIPSMRIQNFKFSDGYISSEVTAVVERNKGELIFGHFNAITIYNGKDKKYIPFNHLNVLPTVNRVQDLAIDKEKNVWMVAEKGGIGKLNLKNEIEWYGNPSTTNQTTFSIFIDDKNDVYASTRFDVFKFNGKKFEKINLIQSHPNSLKRKLFIFDDNEFYIASSSVGIIKKDQKNNCQYIGSSVKQNANNVFYIHKTKNGELLAGTFSGLYKVDSDSLKKFRDGKFQIDRPVYFILDDNRGSLWFGTDNGVIKWDGESVDMIGKKEGLSGLETNRDAGFLDSYGNIWIGTNNGVSKYQFEYDLSVRPKPILYFEYLDHRTGNTDLRNDIELSADENDLTFYFKSISFTDEKENTFKVKLEGFDKDWLDEFRSDKPQIRYTNLHPGTYKLHVKSKNGSGEWSDEIISKAITIDKPYYEKFWFIFLILLSVIGIIIFIFLFVQKLLYSNRLEIEVRERTEQLYESRQRYKKMFKDNSTIMLLVDIETQRIIDINPAAQEYYGYNYEIMTSLDLKFFEIEKDINDYSELKNGDLNYYQAIHKTKVEGNRSVEVYPSIINFNNKPAIYIIIKDVTDRLKAIKGLQESEEKFRGLVDSIQDGIFVFHKKVLQYCNKAFASMLGYSVEEAIGSELAEFVAPENLEFVLHQYKRRQEHERIDSEYEAVLIKKNKSEKVFVNIHAGLTKFNNKIATIGTVKNITEKRKQDKQLKILHTAIEHSPVCVIITDQNAIIEYVNPMFCDLYGYQYSEVIGKNINIIRSENYSDEIHKQMWDTIRSGNTWRGELLNKSKSGKDYWVGVGSSPIKDDNGNITHFIGVEEDITFDKYAREEIENNEKLINSVLSKVPILIFALDSEGIIKVAKGTILNLIELDKIELIGRSISVLNEKYTFLEEDVKRALNSESFTVERYLDEVTTEMTYTPIIRENGTFGGTIGVVYDITARHKVEKELKRAKYEADKSNNLKTEFLAQMSHEIRTPINSILSFSMLIKDHLENKLSDELAQSFDFIEAGGRRLIRTIDMILNMSQFQTGTYKPNVESLDLGNEIIPPVLKELSSLAEQKSLSLSFNDLTSSSVIAADRYTVSQIFVNLIENAIKYSNEGNIDINLINVNGSIIVEVNDQGIGISEEFLPNLFSPFLQEERGYTRKYEGNGLGLALVKNYVDVNNAEISVESAKGEGSKFTVKFKKP